MRKDPGAVAQGATSLSGRRAALLIGNNAYRFARPLQNATHDATDLGGVLQRAAFETTVLTDASLPAITAATGKFAGSLKDGDTALWFFAGHGVQIGTENYLVPVDFDPKGGVAAVKSNCVAASRTLETIAATGAGLHIVILDACRTNPFQGNLVPAKGLALMEGELGSYVALSAGPGQVAAEMARDRNGLFTKYLLAEAVKPGQTIDAVFNRVKKQVFDSSGGTQRPWLHGDVVSEFYFMNAGGTPAPQLPSPNTGTPKPLDPLLAGERQFLSGHFDEAVKAFELALRVHPEDPYVYDALGAAYARLGRWSLAVGLYGKAIQLKPDYATAYHNRGVAYYSAGRYDLAIQDFTWAIDSEPFDPQLFYLRGRSYLGSLESDNALSDFNRSLALDPYEPAVLTARGRVYLRLGKYREAYGDLSQAIGIMPTAEAYDVRSLVLRGLSRQAEAEADKREAARLRH